jgi:hypothetical protein
MEPARDRDGSPARVGRFPLRQFRATRRAREGPSKLDRATSLLESELGGGRSRSPSYKPKQVRWSISSTTLNVRMFPALTHPTGNNGNCAITGGYVYRGSIPRLRGRYVFGNYCSGRIWSVALRGGRAAARRLEPVRARQLTSFGADSRGELYATTLRARLPLRAPLTAH